MKQMVALQPNRAYSSFRHLDQLPVHLHQKLSIMMSPIKPDEAMIEQYKALILERADKIWVLKINNSKLELVFRGDKSFNLDSLPDQLPPDQPRFVIYNFDYETDELPPLPTSKIIIIYWCPSGVGFQKKLAYSTSLGEVVTTLGSIQKQLQVDDYSQLEHGEIRRQILSSN